ncbi:MAG: hypothetical protein ABWY06_06220 [Pseudomonas sp.]|uniref:hypothetical protein n=1 Tax=Pseudomonas sp. TaxID=306 RepID=UPI0033975196
MHSDSSKTRQRMPVVKEILVAVIFTLMVTLPNHLLGHSSFNIFNSLLAFTLTATVIFLVIHCFQIRLEFKSKPSIKPGQ